MSFLNKIFLYGKLLFSLNSYYKYYIENNKYDSILLDNVLKNVSNCGAVMIKFCQWITPKLELIYLESNDITKGSKPEWLTKMEQFYENCEEHDIEYTKEEYFKTFKQDINEKYELLEVIGSGSIGQVYLINDKKKNKHKVLKILHPGVASQINFFKTFLKFILFFPCIKNKIMGVLPFDLFEFINQFLEQTNLVNEANNLLYFERFYNNNEYIVIPKLFKISKNILIMSYEPGINIESKELNDYKVNKLVNLYHLFVRENQMIENFNHGDLHPGNWRVRVEDNKCKLIIYDFGFCWKQNQTQFEEMGDLMTDTFESSNRESNEVSSENLSKIVYYSVLYDKEDKETEHRERIKTFIESRLSDLEPWKLSPIVLMKAIIDFCKINNLFLDPTLLQGFIVIIQGQKLFEKYELMASDKNFMDDYTVFRERYLNILTFCKTYNIFPGYSEYVEKRLNKKQVNITSIFDTINIDDIDLKNMALDK